MDTNQPLQDQALDHVRELLATHWREAKGSADDDGKFAIGLRISVQNGAPGVILFEATRTSISFARVEQLGCLPLRMIL